MLLTLALVNAHAQEPIGHPPIGNPNQILVRHPYWAEPTQPRDCSMSGDDYTELREALVSLRQMEGHSIGVAARGHQCSLALDTLIRNGPFLGVHRVTPGETDQCTAVLGPGPGGFALSTIGDCSGPHAEAHTDELYFNRVVSLAWWYPYGASVRWNEDLGDGFSLLLDIAWQLPEPGTRPDLSDDIEAGNRSTLTLGMRETAMRGLAGFDLSRDDLRGSFVGFRAGVESKLTDKGPESLLDPNTGIVSFLFGHKWISESHFALQLAAGAAAEIPMRDVGPRPERLTPVIELRGGLAGARR